MEQAALFLGFDIGTTTITAIVLNVFTGEVVARATAANEADCMHPALKEAGWAELDMERVHSIVCNMARQAVQQIDGQAHRVAGIGVTGQMHDVVFVGGNPRLWARAPILPFAVASAALGCTTSHRVM